ncbi:hypothetical protein BJX64DRAFT_258874 [Aspergillus heterothallicus]
MGVEALEQELLAVFSDIYGYKTESFTIPIVASAVALHQKLANWTSENHGPRTLRMLVYSGHASDAGTTSAAWYFGGRANSNGQSVGPQINRFNARKNVELGEGDVCYIFGCCSGGAAALYDGPEVICASGWDQQAASNLNSSFTRALIDTLKGLDGATETIAGIYSILFRSAHQSQVAACPVHVQRQGRPSITLGKLPPADGTTGDNKKTKTEHRVLLSVHIKDSKPDIQAWNNWLSNNLPPGLLSADVRIESIFRTSSSVLLVTIPVELWTMLDLNDESFSFVAHVQSSNILPALERSLQTPLPFRPGPGARSAENTPPHSHKYRKSLG